jgi:hypothetical protein
MWRPSLRFQRAVAALAVCLPVPVCAASGLSLPLPTTVERVAAALVPWIDAVPMSANEALRPGVAGSIVVQANERNVVAAPVAQTAAVTTAGRQRSKKSGRVVVRRPGLAAVPLIGFPIVSDGAAPTEGVAANPTAGGGTPAVPGVSSPAPRAGDHADAAGGGQPQPAVAPAPQPTPPTVTDKPASAPPTASTPSEPPPASPPRSEPSPVAPVTNVVEQVAAPVVAPVAPIVEATQTTVEQTKTVVEQTVAPVTGLLPGIGK